MPGLSNYTKNQLLGWIKGINYPAAPVAVYISLYSNATNDDASGTEITGTITGGNRPAVTFGAIDNNERILNAPLVTITASAAGNGNIHSIGLHTTATPSTGNLIIWEQLGAVIPVVAGQSVVIPLSSLIVHLDKPC